MATPFLPPLVTAAVPNRLRDRPHDRLPGRPPGRRFALWPLAVVLLGAAIELRAYVFNRSLWLDEASISLNITQRGYRALTEPLSFGQAAPIAWLWLEHAAVQAFGPHEQALRLLPLLSGLLSLLLFWRIAQQMLSRPGAAVAVALFAVSPFVLAYATEVKPYATDVTCALALLLGALSLQPARRPKRRHYARWGLLGSALVWLSNTSPLLFLGLTAALLVLRRRGPDLRAIGWLAASTVPFALSLGLAYRVTLEGSSTNAILLAFWQSGFLPLPVALGTGLSWLGERAGAFLVNPLGLGSAVTIGVLLAIGLHSLRGQRAPQRTLLVMAFPPFLAAACVHLYPFSERLILLLVPFALLLLAASVDHPSRLLQVPALAISLALLAGSAVAAGRLLVHPAQREELGAALDFLTEHHQPGDVVLVDHFAQPAFAFYGPAHHLVQAAAFSKTAEPIVDCQDQAALAGLVGPRRVWLVFGHFGVHDPDHGRVARARLSLYGQPTLSLTAYGAGVYLFEPGGRARPLTTGPASTSTSASPCLQFVPGPAVG